MRRGAIGVAAAVLAAFLAGFAVTRHVLESDVPVAQRETTHVFVTGSQSLRLLKSGWSWPEPAGTWSVGPVAEMEFPLGVIPISDVVLSISARSISIPGHPGTQKVRMIVNGERLSTLRFNTEEDIVDGKVTVPQGLIDGSKPLQIKFEIATPVSPRQTLSRNDDRLLGFNLHQIVARYVPREFVQ
jgi:hypothetical protein